ncbi:MAG: GvpL/GvpF family gas vesicle protein [Candidatus Euphemobacter frigidus]|nr:GvpL/GvpF family gas vesicle protein [Candidatus Euphemobacter frigidus]MDP8274793.1 GvpL/GvpF family gas vesicle protein [Candidatus Euphemobacter frigidus]
MEEGRYIYCIIGDREERKFDSPAIGERGDDVYSISHRDIAAVISVSPIIKYPISRANTMAHQKVLEELMDDFTVLPVRFGTIAGGKENVAPDDRIREEVLKTRYEELKDLSLKMDNKMELGLKAIWTDMESIFREIVDENTEIRRLRQKLISHQSVQSIPQRATLGELVKEALERKKAKEEKNILGIFKRTSVEWRGNKVFGDAMITNLAFLVDKTRAGEFDGLMDKLATEYNGRTKFKYIGPVPPINFVELVITLDEE